MKTILVTGGAGYIGSTLVRLLLERGFRVVVLDKLMFGDESLVSVMSNPDFTLIKGDITDVSDVRKTFTNRAFDAVVHMAAIVGDPACARDPELAEKVNLHGAVNVLEASLEYNVPRFIFISTCSNYGKMQSAGSLVDEQSPLAPVSLYAELKVKFEKILFEKSGREGFCPIILRFATAFGLSHRMRFDLTVNEFTKELVMGRELAVFGKQFWRPYCHVRDLSRAVILALEADMTRIASLVFNVGDSDENYQKQMIVDEVSRVVENPRIKYVTKVEDPRDYRVSFEKIKKELGFTITTTVPDGIQEIKKALKDKELADPDDKKYYNT